DLMEREILLSESFLYKMTDNYQLLYHSSKMLLTTVLKEGDPNQWIAWLALDGIDTAIQNDSSLMSEEEREALVGTLHQLPTQFAHWAQPILQRLIMDENPRT